MLRDALCRRNRRGQKTAAGYYDYDAERSPTTSAEETQLIRAAYGPPSAATPPDDAEILERSLFPMVNEGARILEEGIAQRASDVDMVYLTGYGFPLHRGGPMCYADTVGLYNVVQTMKRFAANPLDDASFWQPAPLLAKLAAEGKSFS